MISQFLLFFITINIFTRKLKSRKFSKTMHGKNWQIINWFWILKRLMAGEERGCCPKASEP